MKNENHWREFKLLSENRYVWFGSNKITLFSPHSLIFYYAEFTEDNFTVRMTDKTLA